MIRRLAAAALFLSATALAEPPPYQLAGPGGVLLITPEINIGLTVPEGWLYRRSDTGIDGMAVEIQTPSFDFGFGTGKLWVLNEIHCISTKFDRYVPEGVTTQDQANQWVLKEIEKRNAQIAASNEPKMLKTASGYHLRGDKVMGYLSRRFELLSDRLAGRVALDAYVRYVQPGGGAGMSCRGQFAADGFVDHPNLKALDALQESVAPLNR